MDNFTFSALFVVKTIDFSLDENGLTDIFKSLLYVAVQITVKASNKVDVNNLL